MKRHVSLKETAQIFGVTKGTISTWAKKGLLYPIYSIDHRRGGYFVFFKSQDVAFLKKVIKRLPIDRRNGRHIVSAYRHAVEEEWRKMQDNGH